jgi:serine/threonine-protein kinase
MINVKEKIWGSDWFIGLMMGISLLFIAQLNLLAPLEQIIYDWSIQYIDHVPGDQVAVVAIDDSSLAQLGDWPWSRAVYAQMINLLAPYSRVIGSTLNLTKAQQEPGLIYLDELGAFYTRSDLLKTLPKHIETLDTLIRKVEKIRINALKDKDKAVIRKLTQLYLSSGLSPQLINTLTTLEEKIQAAYIELDSDQKLANSFNKAGNIILGMSSHLTDTLMGIHPPPLPGYLLKHQLSMIQDPFDNVQDTPQPLTGLKIYPPLAKFSNSILGLGYTNTSQPDLNPRQMPLIIRYDNHYFPALSLLLAAQYLKLNHKNIEVRLGKGVNLGGLRINTDAQLQIRPFFYSTTATKKSALVVDSFADVLSGRIHPKKYQDKVVLLGTTAPRYSFMQSTPLGEMPTVLITAHTLASLLNQDFLTTPAWGIWLQVGLFVIILAYLCLILPYYLKPFAALIGSVVSIGGLGVVYFSLMQQGLFVSLILPLTLIPVGHIGLLIKRSIIAYQDVFRSHPDAVESNRLLGLAFQGQGHLDMAFEKFRLCPPDDAILSLIYNLALDYELKRQFRRAGAVYRYILNYAAHFRDAEQRLERLRRLRRPQIFHKNGSLTDWLLEENNEKPLIGRYQIERQLGKGAMGAVYLGRDPKLDRLVAIKTLMLSQEFEAGELEEATRRFFREAAAAGRLTHPHIVSIYDAGEEQDVAYISMEFFKGGNLVPYTKLDNLLPIPTASKIAIHIAEALDYACRQGVVHRDIKPANILYNPATSQIKITDFGIARITDSNKTKTGIILGTPSYMSPEQLAGKNLDGRTDLFSLGVMLYQLLTGVLPFQADSMATLMFKIANESHPDIIQIRADIPLSIKRMVDKALQKNAKDRYQNGAQFAQALRECI